MASHPSNAFFLLDALTGLCFLIDTGACRSLLPKSKVHSGCSPGTDHHLIAANGTRILTYGYKSMRLSFGGSAYQWDFIVADVSIPIIGAKFLANFNLLVDVGNRRLVDTSTLASTAMMTSPSRSPTLRTPSAPSSHRIQRSFAQCFISLHVCPLTTAFSTTSRLLARLCFPNFAV